MENIDGVLLEINLSVSCLPSDLLVSANAMFNVSFTLVTWVFTVDFKLKKIKAKKKNKTMR